MKLSDNTVPVALKPGMLCKIINRHNNYKDLEYSLLCTQSSYHEREASLELRTTDRYWELFADVIFTIVGVVPYVVGIDPGPVSGLDLTILTPISLVIFLFQMN